MGRTRTSTSARLLGIAVLVIIWSLTASRAPVEDASPSVPSFRAVMPLLFPTLFAQTQIAGCSNGDVNTGNQINITITKVRGRRVATPPESGEIVQFDPLPPLTETSRTVNLIGAVGSVAGVFLNGVPVQSSWPGDYNQLLITLASQMTYQGAAQCATGGETRYYYSNGSSTSSPCIIGAANAGSPCTVVSGASVSAALNRSDFAATTVTIGGGESAMPLNYTITSNGSITLNVGFDPSIAVYTLSGNNVVFPAVTVSFASQP